MEGNGSDQFRDVKQILTVREAGGKVSQIFTVTQKTSTPQPIVSPVGKIRPGGAYSLLRRDSTLPAKTKSTPSILRKSLKRKFTCTREPYGPAPRGNPASPGGSMVRAADSNAQYSNEMNEEIVERFSVASHSNGRTYSRLPSTQEILASVEGEHRNLIIKPVASPSPSSEPTVRKNFVRGNVPSRVSLRGRGSTFERKPETPPQEEILPVAPRQIEVLPQVSAGPKSIIVSPVPGGLVDVDAIKTEPLEESIVDAIKTEPLEESIVDNLNPPSDSMETTNLNTESPAETGPPEESRNPGYSMPNVSDPGEIMDDAIDHISKNAASDFEKFHMISHQSLMEVLSTCHICASAADVTLRRRGTTCEATIKCRRTEMHDTLWDGEKGRILRTEEGGQKRNELNSSSLEPLYGILRSLMMMCLTARIVEIPLKKLERFCRLLFAGDNIGLEFQAASSLTSSFQVIHGLTRPKLEKPIDCLKVIVVCRKLLVFLDPFSYNPLACFRFRGVKLSSTSDLSSALNIGLQRLQLLNSSKFSSVDVVHSGSSAQDPGEWIPVLVPDMELMYQEALSCLQIALRQNKYEFDIKSRQAFGILEDITRALCFFQPEVAKMSGHEARSHYSLVLSDLSKMHDRQFIPQLDEITPLKRTFKCLSNGDNQMQIKAVIAEVERLDVYNILNPLYEKIISTADSSYVVSIRNEQPCRATSKAMKMIEMCQDDELSLGHALRVLMLLPRRNSPSDLIEGVFGYA